MLTHKNSKFLFYNFNNFLNRISEQPKLIRHTKISDDDFAFKIYRKKTGLTLSNDFKPFHKAKKVFNF